MFLQRNNSSFYSQCRALIEPFVPELAFSELGAILDLLLMYFFLKKNMFLVFFGASKTC